MPLWIIILLVMLLVLLLSVGGYFIWWKFLRSEFQKRQPRYRVFIGTLIKDGENPVDWKPSINVKKTFIIETTLGDMWEIATNQTNRNNEALTAQVMRKLGLYNPIIETYKSLGKSTLEERQTFLKRMTKQFSTFNI